MMKLGIISNYEEKDLENVKELGLEHVEFCINNQEDLFIQELDQIEKTLKKNHLNVMSIGRWGTLRITEKGVNVEELQINLKLIDACERLECPVFVTGVNYVPSLSFQENIVLAIEYLNEINTYAKVRNIKTAVYNCRWENFIVGPDTWDLIQYAIPSIGIKYDPSHAIYDGMDYLKEIKDYGKSIYHIHLKGSLLIDGERVDDPPAGLDITNWQAVMGLLYYFKYEGGLSIEPHSKTWTDELGEFNVKYSINYFKPMIYGVKK